MSRTLRSPLHLALMKVLRETRLEAGLTQADLAKRMDRPQSFVAKIEVGERQLGVVEFVSYAESLGVTPPELLARIISDRQSEGAVTV